MEKKHSNKGICANCLKESIVKDISGIVIFLTKSGFFRSNGKICETCFNELLKHKILWSKENINGMRLRY